MRSKAFLHLLTLSLFAGGLLCAAPPCLAEGSSGNPEEAKILSADALLAQGRDSSKKGAFASAASTWAEAAKLFDQAGNKSRQAEALTRLSQAYQGLGQHQDGLKAAEKALLLAQQEKNEKQRAEALCALGSLFTSLGENERAQRHIEEGIRIAGGLGDPDLRARLLNNLGNALAAQRRWEEALRAYQDSASTLQVGTAAALAAVNSAFVCVSLGRYGEARSLVDQALLLTRGLEDSYTKAHALINAGLLCSDLRSHLADQAFPLTLLSSQALAQAAQVGHAIEDSRTLSYAYGYLGNLYESEGRREEALELTTRAILYAQRSQAPESLYRWYWQSGRILRSLGKPSDAITAYRQALVHVQTVRKEIAACSEASESSFRSTAALIGSQYVDLLLEHASSEEDPQRYLSEARDALEFVKVYELRDYFKDDCVDAARHVDTRLDLLSRSALIVYPILLKDRLELLL